jgi:hypothetical protein
MKMIFSGSSHGGTGGAFGMYPTFSIVKDTVIGSQNFFSFNIFNILNEKENPFPVNSYLSYDSISQKLFIKLADSDDVKLGADFTKPADSTFISYLRGYPVTFKSLGPSKKLIFNDSVMTYSFTAYWFVTTDPKSRAATYTFVDNIGLYKCRYSEGYYSYSYSVEMTLMTAIMDTITINPLDLRITEVKPIVDTPINGFPISVTGSYSATFPELVDTFYLELTLIRDLKPIHKWISGFNKNKIALINPPNLNVGDQIDIRAVIKDKSIHNKFDYFPDTGSVVINVLEPLGIDNHDVVFNFSLNQNYPNPFNPRTIISFDIPYRSFIQLKIFDILGREITTLINNELDYGRHSIEFFPENLPGGIYFYKISCGDFIMSKKMVLLK